MSIDLKTNKYDELEHVDKKMYIISLYIQKTIIKNYMLKVLAKSHANHLAFILSILQNLPPLFHNFGICS